MQEAEQLIEQMKEAGKDRPDGSIDAEFKLTFTFFVTAGFDVEALKYLDGKQLCASLIGLGADLAARTSMGDAFDGAVIHEIRDGNSGEVIPLVGAPTACKQCGSPMHGDYCLDDTCVYSDWPQRVPHGEILSGSATVLRERYNVLPRIRVMAEVYSDDRNLEAPFDAAPWFARASDDEIVDLAEIDWSGDEPADVVAEHFIGSHAGVDSVFDYLNALNTRRGADSMGFECRIDEDSAMAWLKQHRPELWRRIKLNGFFVSIEKLLITETSEELAGLLQPLASERGYSSELNVSWDYWHYGRHAEYAAELGMPDLARLFSAAWQIEHRVHGENPAAREIAENEIRAEYPGF